jgi:hypothetical protein
MIVAALLGLAVDDRVEPVGDGQQGGVGELRTVSRIRPSVAMSTLAVASFRITIRVRRSTARAMQTSWRCTKLKLIGYIVYIYVRTYT